MKSTDSSSTVSSLAPVPPSVPWYTTYAGVILSIGVLTNIATSFIQYAPNLTLPSMRDSLALSYTEAGMLITAVWMCRVPSSFVAGMLASRYGSRILVGISGVSAGLAMGVLSLAPSFIVALLGMSLIGAATGFAIIPMMGLLTAWFNSQTRGLAAGIASAGGSLAFVVAGIVVPWLTDRNPEAGWRYAWAVFGGATMVVGVLALIFLRESAFFKDRSVEKTAQVSSDPPRSLWPAEVYKNPLVWLMTFMVFCSGWSQGIFNTFLGTYLSQENGIDLVVVGNLLVLIGLLSIGSGIVWGRVSDRIGRALAFLLVFAVQGVGLILIWLNPIRGAFFLAAVLIGLTLRATFTICAASAGDFAPIHFAPAAFAVMSTGAGSGAMLSPGIAGALADATGSLQWAFALALAGSVCGAGGSVFLYRLTALRITGVKA